MSNKKEIITIIMVDGHADGIKVVKKSNWDGVGVVCPRGRYSDCKKRKEFQHSGVYILIGDKEDNDGEMRPLIYIGESEAVNKRLEQHTDKDFWRQVVVFTKQSESTLLDKADIKYLESKLLQMAVSNKRCEVENKKGREQNQHSRLSEEDEAAADGYLENMLLLLSVINVRVFESAPRLEQGQKNTVYYYRSANGEWDASGYATNDNRFVVQKDSIAKGGTVQSMTKYPKRKRSQIIGDKVLMGNEKGLRFAQDYEFNSPSEAACVVSGSSVNGWDVWKDIKKVSLKNNEKVK